VEEMEKQIEKANMEAAIDYNYDSCDVDTIFEELMSCEGVPDILK